MAGSPSRTPSELVEPFLDQHRERWSFNTTRAYRIDILRFLKFAAESDRPLALAPYLAAHPQWTQSTARCIYSRVNTFLRYVGDHSTAAIQFTPVPSVPRSGMPRRVFQPQEINRILVQIPAVKVQDALLYRLIYRGCLRVGEVVRLRGKDVLHTADHLYVLQLQDLHSCRKIKTLLITDQDMVDRLKSYLQGRADDALLFQASKSPSKEPLRQQNVYKRWKQYCVQADLECSLEDLRISGVARLVEQRAQKNAKRIRP